MTSPSETPAMKVEDGEERKPNIMVTVTTQVVANKPTRQPQALDTPESNHSSLTTNVAADEFPDIDDDSSNFNNISRKEQHEYFNSFPPGYRFCPTDEELIVFYLKMKVLNERLPPNRIVEVNLYKYNPEFLAEKYKECGEKEWYFFTPRDRKYRNGNRPNRAAGDGYWKATGADKEVKSDEALVGLRKALVFYKGKPPKGDKSNWIMHEFRVSDPPQSKRGANGMRLDDWVLCRIYKKTDKSTKTQTQVDEGHTVVDSSSLHEDEEDENIEMNCGFNGAIAGLGPMIRAEDNMQKPFQNGVTEFAQFSNAALGNKFQAVGGKYATPAKKVQAIAFRPPWVYSTENVFGSKYLNESIGYQDDFWNTTNPDSYSLSSQILDLHNYNIFQEPLVHMDHIFPGSVPNNPGSTD